MIGPAPRPRRTPRSRLALAPGETRTLVFLLGVLMAFIARRKAADNPWGAGATTLEWTLPSPPAFHSYETLPRIQASEHH